MTYAINCYMRIAESRQRPAPSWFIGASSYQLTDTWSAGANYLTDIWSPGANYLTDTWSPSAN